MAAKKTARILCVAEGWTTKPMPQETAERLVAAGFPDCYSDHRIIPASGER